MLLYHASYMDVKSPDIKHSRDNLDFGKGFYLTSYREQAENYANRFKRRGRRAWLCIYEFEIEINSWNILELREYNLNWLDFISKCRAGEDTTTYDIVIGGIANDKVIRTLDRYFMGELTKDQALGQLIFEKPNIQYCIRSQELINQCLRHIESIEL